VAIRKYTKSNKSRVRINGEIRAREVRVIDEENHQIGIMGIEDAVREAKERELDLVEISPKAEPPVCKIVDYGKFKYLEKKRLHEAKKRQTVVQVKEIKLRPRTDEHDRAYKIRNLKKFLEDGNKVKVTLGFRGREIVYSDRANEIFDRIIEEVDGLAKIEKNPVRAGRAMSMVLAPVPRGKT
jgi:translation initiation factor IF-3